MKLAEALAERADLQNRLSQLERRLSLNARVQEGESPAEDPRELLTELDDLSARLEELVFRINKTNALVEDGGESLTLLLARRDSQSNRLRILREFLDCASALTERATRAEIRIKSTVPVSDLRKQVDAQSKALRTLDARIQSLNWTHELQ